MLINTSTRIRIKAGKEERFCTFKELIDNNDFTQQERGEILESLELHEYIHWCGGAQPETLIEAIDNRKGNTWTQTFSKA